MRSMTRVLSLIALVLAGDAFAAPHGGRSGGARESSGAAASSSRGSSSRGAASASRSNGGSSRSPAAAARGSSARPSAPAARPAGPAVSAERRGAPHVRYTSGARPARPGYGAPYRPGYHVHAASPPRYRWGRPVYRPYSYGPAYPPPVIVHQAPPVRHVYSAPPPPPAAAEPAPKRGLEREDTLAVGLNAGSVISGYGDAKPYADLGFGLAARFRPEESVGLELAVSSYKQEFSAESDRTTTTGQASVELFASPWSRVSPYALAGLTVAGRTFADDRAVRDATAVENLTAKDVQWGPHVGLGVEFALGRSVALDLEARGVGFIGQDAADPRIPGMIQTTAGLKVHF